MLEQNSVGLETIEPVEATCQPMLTICIPTYNRAAHLQKLLWTLQFQILPLCAGELDIVVVNNASKDQTRQILDGVTHPAIRVVHRDEFLLTAEENIIHSLDFCRGEFVWFLGDDDVPVVSNFLDHLERIRRNDVDFLVFNAALADKNGTLFSIQALKMNRAEVIGSIADVVLSCGCLFVFAGISNIIVRRSALSLERGLHYLQVSRIYSMVAWLIEAGAGRRAALINRPLVYYRENDYSLGHWERIASRMDVGDFFFWSTGLVQLFSTLIESGYLTWWQMGQIFDVDREGARYRLIDDMIYKLYQQVHIGRKRNAHSRQQLSTSAFEICRAFCLKADPLSFDILSALSEFREHKLEKHSSLLFRAPKDTQDADAKFLRLFGARRHAGQHLCRVQQIFHGYEILWTPIQYVAVRAGVASLRERAMQQVDPVAQPPLIYVAATRDALLEIVGEQVATEQAKSSTFGSSELSSLPDMPVQTALLSQLEASNQLIAAIYNSDSWALAYPFRAFARFLRYAVRLTGAMLRLVPAALLRRR